MAVGLSIRVRSVSFVLLNFFPPFPLSSMSASARDSRVKGFPCWIYRKGVDALEFNVLEGVRNGVIGEFDIFKGV